MTAETVTATCATCRFVHAKGHAAKQLPSTVEGSSLVYELPAGIDYQCRIRAKTDHGWPYVAATDWCGEHQPSPTVPLQPGDVNQV